MRSRPPYAITMNWASRAKLLREIGPFDVSLLRCQDVDLAYRIVQAGYRLEYAADAVVHHRNRSTIRALCREGYLHGRGGLAVRRIHAGYLAAFPAAPSYWRRLRTGLGWFGDVRQWRRAGFKFLFELSKIGGELRGELR
jgi:GT2 family glycosyltransferase